jgi:hypothetical protein
MNSTLTLKFALQASMARSHTGRLAAPVAFIVPLRPASSAVAPSSTLRIDPQAMAARRSERRA